MKFALVVLLCSTPAWAEPYLAVREGLPCAACHVNKTGGGKRTAFGAAYSQFALPIVKSAFVDPRLGDYLTMGADFRFENVTLRDATGSYQGQPLAAATANTFRMPVGNLYLDAELVKARVSLYFDEILAPESASSRETFLLIHDLPLGGYVKLGRFLLPYGLRFPDDTIFVREVTGFNYGNQDLGIELGGEWRRLHGAVAITNGTLGGTDNNTNKQITGTLGAWWQHARVGASYSWNNGSTDRSQTTRRVLGAYAALGAGRVQLIGEADFVRDWQAGPAGSGPPPTERWQWAAYGELDVLAVRGVNLRLAYDFADPDIDVPEDQRERFTFGADVFALPFARVSLFYYLRRDIPQKVEGNQDMIIVRFHGYL